MVFEHEEGILAGKLELHDDTVDFVEHEAQDDTLGQGLSQNSFRLDANTLGTVYNDQRAVRDTEGGRDLRREVYMPRRVDEVDQITAGFCGGNRVFLILLLILLVCLDILDILSALATFSAAFFAASSITTLFSSVHS